MIKSIQWEVTKWALIFGGILSCLAIFYLKSWWAPCLGFVVSLFFCWGFITMALTRKIPAKSFVFYDKNVIGTYPEATWFWNWPYERFTMTHSWESFPGKVLSYAAEAFHGEMTGRKGLRYKIVLTREESPQAVAALIRFLEISKGKFTGFQELAHFIMFEFVNSCERGVLENLDLHNPLEISQQEAYRNSLGVFIENFLEEYGGTGFDRFMYIGTGTHFEISDQPGTWKIEKAN